MASSGPRRMDYLVYGITFILIGFVLVGSVYSSGSSGSGGGGCCGCSCCGQTDQSNDGAPTVEADYEDSDDDDEVPQQPATHACTGESADTHAVLSYSITNNSDSFSYECTFDIKACGGDVAVTKLYLTDGSKDYQLSPGSSYSHVRLNTSSSYTGTADDLYHYYPQCVMELDAPDMNSITCTENNCNEN